MNPYIVLLHDETVIPITLAEREQMRHLKHEGYFDTLSGQRVKGSDIAGILNSETYYTQFPDKRPDENIVRSIADLVRTPSRKRDLMLKGLQEYIDANPPAHNARALYKQIVERGTISL